MDTDVRRIDYVPTPVHRSVPNTTRDTNDEHGSFEEALDSGAEDEEPQEQPHAAAEGRAVSPRLDDESGGRLDVVG